MRDKETKVLLKKILTIIDFKEDKDEFIDMLIALITEEAIYNLIHSLPKIKQDKVARKWDNNANNTAALVSIMKHYFETKQIEEAFEETAMRAIVAYLNSVDDQLTKQQRKELFELSNKLNLNPVN